MRKAKRKESLTLDIKINESIRVPEVRVIDDEEGNLGVMKTADAIAKAYEKGLDLIEISPDANPPVAKIMDYGKYGYEQKKKQRDIRAKARAAAVEVKNVQIKPGTSVNDLIVKAKKSSEWLLDGDRVKVELYLRGRVKYLGKEFLEDRLHRLLTNITVPFTIVDNIKNSPKGLYLIIELDRKKYELQQKDASAALDVKIPDEIIEAHDDNGDEDEEEEENEE